MSIERHLFRFTLLALPLSAQNSFVDFSGITEGALQGSAPWASFGTVSYDVVFNSNSDGAYESGALTPRLGPLQSNLEPFGPELGQGLLLIPGRIDGEPSIDRGYELDFTFDDGAGVEIFPAETVFYLSDIDNTSTSVGVKAFLDGLEVATSTWFSQSVQTKANGTGLPAAWDPATQTLTGVESGELWVHQFAAPSGVEFDQLVFDVTATNSGDRIAFGLGNTIVTVPEPSCSLFILASSLTFLTRRRRSVG
ncbi:MAG: hypothetical protein ACSHYB_11880 [Roseibacillus sp.]